MSSTTNEVSIKMMYEDSSTRLIRFTGVTDSALQHVKDKINAINADVPQAMKDTFVSAEGAKFMWIAGGTIIVTEEEVIYSA